STVSLTGVSDDTALPSAAAAGAPAVQALVARAVADHDRAAVHARRGVRLGGEGDLHATEVERDPAPVLGLRCAVAVAVRPVAVRQRAVRGDDRELLPLRSRLARRL